MGNVIDLRKFRGSRRREYLRKHEARVDRFVELFLETYVHVDFARLAHTYQDGRRENYQHTWDYVDFREILREAFEAAFTHVMGEELRKQPWYDRRYTSVEQILERCLSTFIMNQCEYAIVK